jgi:hypothetical protein
MDQGRNRNGKDLLDIEGCKNPDDTATAIRWVYMITNNKMKSNSSLPPQVALELYRGEYKGVEKFCAYGQKIYANRGAPRALATALCYLFWQADQRKAQEFIEAWSTGNETYINPLRHAHEHMTRLRDRHLIQKAGKEMRITYAAMIIKAWNLFCVGRRKCYAKAVIYNIHEEQFPMIDGLEVTRYFIKLAIDPSNPPKSTTKKAA